MKKDEIIKSNKPEIDLGEIREKAELILKQHLDAKILVANSPDYTFNKVIEAMLEFSDVIKKSENKAIENLMKSRHEIQDEIDRLKSELSLKNEILLGKFLKEKVGEDVLLKSGKQLKFISKINRDGSGVSEISESHIEMIKDDKFELKCLSLSEKTFIAHGFNSFVVRLKQDNRPNG